EHTHNCKCQHSHNHGEAHTHDHHGHEGDKEKDLEILGLLLDHWASHNQDHAKEYKNWVEKMKASGKADVAKCIEEAIELMSRADTHLMEAKKILIKK
ncbi:MAG: zinc transporter, partial [Eubacterium sp.]